MSDPILVGLALRDDDDAPLALARELARFTGAPLALVNVYPYEPRPRVPVARVRARAARRRPPEAGARSPRRSAASSTSTVHVVRPRLRRCAGCTTPPLALDAVAARGRLDPPRAAAPRHARRRRRAAAARGSLRRRASRRAATPAARRRIRRIGVAFVDTPEGHDALDAAAVDGGARRRRAHALHRPRAARTTRADRARQAGSRPPLRAERADRAGRRPALRARSRPASSAELVVEEGEPCDRSPPPRSSLDLLVCGSRGYGPLRTVLLGSVSGAARAHRRLPADRAPARGATGPRPVRRAG